MTQLKHPSSVSFDEDHIYIYNTILRKKDLYLEVPAGHSKRVTVRLTPKPQGRYAGQPPLEITYNRIELSEIIDGYKKVEISNNDTSMHDLLDRIKDAYNLRSLTSSDIEDTPLPDINSRDKYFFVELVARTGSYNYYGSAKLHFNIPESVTATTETSSILCYGLAATEHTYENSVVYYDYKDNHQLINHKTGLNILTATTFTTEQLFIDAYNNVWLRGQFNFTYVNPRTGATETASCETVRLDPHGFVTSHYNNNTVICNRRSRRYYLLEGAVLKSFDIKTEIPLQEIDVANIQILFFIPTEDGGVVIVSTINDGGVNKVKVTIYDKEVNVVKSYTLSNKDVISNTFTDFFEVRGVSVTDSFVDLLLETAEGVSTTEMVPYIDNTPAFLTEANSPRGWAPVLRLPMKDGVQTLFNPSFLNTDRDYFSTQDAPLDTTSPITSNSNYIAFWTISNNHYTAKNERTIIVLDAFGSEVTDVTDALARQFEFNDITSLKMTSDHILSITANVGIRDKQRSVVEYKNLLITIDMKGTTTCIETNNPSVGIEEQNPNAVNTNAI